MAELSLTAETLIQRSEEVVHSTIDGEVVMMSVEQGSYYGLDAIGSRIWNLLERPAKVGDLCQALMKEFEVDEARCFQDVAAFLKAIGKQKIIAIKT